MTSRNDSAIDKSCFVKVLIIFFSPCTKRCRPWPLCTPSCLVSRQAGAFSRLGSSPVVSAKPHCPHPDHQDANVIFFMDTLLPVRLYVGSPVSRVIRESRATLAQYCGVRTRTAKKWYKASDCLGPVKSDRGEIRAQPVIHLR